MRVCIPWLSFIKIWRGIILKQFSDPCPILSGLWRRVFKTVESFPWCRFTISESVTNNNIVDTSHHIIVEYHHMQKLWAPMTIFGRMLAKCDNNNSIWFKTEMTLHWYSVKRAIIRHKHRKNEIIPWHGTSLWPNIPRVNIDYMYI